ncbi:MAG: NUDIX hydrolase [Pseudomonadales bacterium]|nr:NUDIX hydrolase [Pseudomonadales bacterium]
MTTDKRLEIIGPWKRRSTKEVYDNPWISVCHDEVLTPAGGSGIYGRVHFKSKAVGIIPIDKQGNTWLVHQYRYALREYSWEIPMGGSPLGTDPLETAKRELKEETGLSADHWVQLMRVHTSNSVTDEEGLVFVAEELTQGEMQLEATEDITVKKLPFSVALAMVMDGRITDCVSVAGLLRYAREGSNL